MRCFRWLSGLAVVGGLQVLAPAEAGAQTVTVTESAITRSTALRTTSLNPYWTSRDDCDKDSVYKFPLVLSGFPTDGSVVLQVWASTAGVDCSVTTNRSTSTQQCWKVSEDYTPSTGFNPVIEVPVRSILTANTTSQVAVKGDASICATAAASGVFSSSAPQAVTLFFLPIQATTVVGTGYQYPTGGGSAIKVDLNGPSAPGNVKLGVGENLLIISWSQVTTGDILGYNFYCDPPPGKEDANVGGPTGTAGTAGTSTTTSTCAGTAGTAGTTGTSGASGTAGAAGTAGTVGVSGSSGSTAGTTTDTQGYQPSDSGENEDNVGGTTGSAGSDVGTGIGGGSGSTGSAGSDVGTGIGGTASGVAGTAGGGGVAGAAGGGGVAGTAGGGGVGIGTGTSGTSGASGSDGCGTVSSCPSTNLVAGQVLANPAKYLCGSVSGLSATKGTIEKLKNFKQYTVAVAATDAVGNVGKLSLLTCDTPQPIDDFYQKYRDADGKAGGGYCQASGPLGLSSGGAAGALGAIGAVVVGGWARRRRSGGKR